MSVFFGVGGSGRLEYRGVRWANRASRLGRLWKHGTVIWNIECNPGMSALQIRGRVCEDGGSQKRNSKPRRPGTEWFYLV